MGLLSLTNISITLCVAYVTHSVYNFYQIYYVQPCDFVKSDSCISSYLIGQDEVQLILQGSKHKSDVPRDLLLHETINPYEPWTRVINVSLPAATRQNGSYFLHMTIVPLGKNGKEWQTTTTVPITRYAPPRVKAFSLMGNGSRSPSKDESEQYMEQAITHFKSRVVLSVMTEDISLDARAMPVEIYRHLKHVPNHPNSFLPIAYIDQLSFRAKDLVEVTMETSSLELNIDYKPISAGKLKLWEILRQSLHSLKSFGFGDNEIDEVKGLFADTNLSMLMLTVVVSAFHLLFDFLAFKNDISYWKTRKNMVGLSTRVVVWRTISTIIIFVYLHDQGTSLLVLVPAAISALIEIWKLKKALKVSITWSGWMPALKFGQTSDKERETGEFDATAMYYLNFILYPLLVAGAIYSLLYTPHKSWYSWCLQSLVNGVYAFGFIFMLPQLFVNYKLKSVAHLPWKAFMYKAFNTFIDDIFAFIITMPTAHRVACFRDDIVFVIYLYQRWLYPVDKTRTNEYGQSFDEDKDKKEK